MSQVNAFDFEKIDTADDVLHLYQGAGAEAKIGAEIELAFFDPQTRDLVPMSITQNKALKAAALNAVRSGINNEPSSETLEIATIAEKPKGLRAVMDDMNSKMMVISAKASGLGLKRSYFQDLPDKTADQLLSNIVNIDRYQAFFVPPRDDMRGFAEYFTVCKSNQVSVSYRNPNHLLANIRRLYYLAPFLFMIHDNSAGFNQGKRVSGHAAMTHRASLGHRGGYFPYLFTARSGEEYLAAHIHHVMNNPLFVFYNEEGRLQKVPNGEWVTFSELRAEGLNTASNFWLSQSVIWPDVKIATLKDEEQKVTGHRYEARMFGVGMHQHQSAMLIVSALAFNENFAARVDTLLSNYGFNPEEGHALEDLVSRSYKNAMHHNGHFLDIGFGNGSMQEFAREFGDLLENGYLATEFEDDLVPILAICRTGCTDTKVNTALFDTLDKVKDFQRSFNPSLFNNPRSCAYMVFDKEINSEDYSSCAAINY